MIEEAPMPATTSQGRSVASKVLAILEVFEALGLSLNLTQISDATGLPISTTHRLAREMVDWGALDRDANGRYYVGLRLWEVAQNGGGQLRHTVRPFLQDLFSLTQETSHLAIRQGHEALYIDRVYSSKRVPRASRVGGRLPLHATAVGKVLLAYEDTWVRDAYIGRALESPTTRTHVTPSRLVEELATIRDKGYATTLEEARLGACSIAVPVMGEEGRAKASIGLVMFSTQATKMTGHLPVLTGVAHRIEAAVSRYPVGYLTDRGDRSEGTSML